MTLTDKEKLAELQSKITDSMMGIFESVKLKKDREYQNKTDASIPADVNKLIATCGNVNAAVSGGAGLIPGPWGMAAAVPEIALIIKHQVELIYDIGRALGKDDTVLTTELLLGIFASASGSVGIGLITVHGGKILVKRASLRVMQKVITLLGGKVTQKLLKSMVAKWLPGIGAVAMATWSKVSTNIVGKRAVEVLSKDIVFEEQELLLTGEEFHIIDDDSEPLLKSKITLLTNLMKVDGVSADEEKSHILSLIEKENISDDLTFTFMEQLKSDKKGPVDYEIIRKADQALPMMMDLIALAQIDGEIHEFERAYLIQAGKSLGFTDCELEGMLGENPS